MRLDRPVDDPAGHRRRDHLDHRDLGARGLVAHGIHHVRGFQRQQSRLFDHAARFGDAFVPDGLFGDGLAEGHARAHAPAQQFQRAFGRADRAHAMVDAARAEAALGDLETAALAEQQILRRYAHVAQHHFHMPVRRVVVAEYAERAQHFDAGRIGRYQHHGLLLVHRGRGIGLAHDDVEPAARIAGAGGVPLAAVDDVAVAVATDRTLDVGRIRRGHRRFGHQESRSDRAGEQWFEPAVLLRLAAVALQRFHVAGVRRRTVEYLGSPGHATHDLTQRRVFEVGQALGRALRTRQEQIPQAGLARQRLQLLDRLQRLPRVAGGAMALHFLVVRAFVGNDVLGEEGFELRPKGFDAGRVGEVHRVSAGKGRRALARAVHRILGSARGRRKPRADRVRKAASAASRRFFRAPACASWPGPP